MKRLLSVTLLLSILLSAQWASAQTGAGMFGNSSQNTRSVDGSNLADPQISPGDIQPDPTTQFRNIYLVYRFYSCNPWRYFPGQIGPDVPGGNNVRSVQSDYDGFTMQVDTANNNDNAQLQQDLNHPAYGLYCLRVVICIPYYSPNFQPLWVQGRLHQFFVRLSYYCPGVCWCEGWWWYRSFQHPSTDPYGIAHSPSWAPWHRWDRGGPFWNLTIIHPYCYTWGSPFYQPTPFCVYGLRSCFFTIGNPRQPGRVCGNKNLNQQFICNWVNYPYPQPYRYWPYIPYCARWYWWRFPTTAAFQASRWLPPVAQYGVAVGAPPDFVYPQPSPSAPFPIIPQYTCAVCTTRPVLLPQGDTDGDGVVGIPDQANFKAETGNANQDLADSDNDPTTP